MAQIPTNVSRWRRFFGWFARHKVAAVFAVLFVVLGLYLAGSWVVLRVQIHSERVRFMSTNGQMVRLSRKITNIGRPKIKAYRNCSYTDNGALFAKRFLGCETGVAINYADIDKSHANDYSQQILSLLRRDGITLRDNVSAVDVNDLFVKVYDAQKLACIFTSTYYETSVPTQDRDESAGATGPVNFLIIDCSGPAKAEYFPVTDN